MPAVECNLSERCRCAAENRRGTCDTGSKQLTGTRSKTAGDQQDVFAVPSCQKQVAEVQKKAKFLRSHVEICKLDALPRRKATMRTSVQSRGAMNSLQSPKRIAKGSANGR